MQHKDLADLVAHLVRHRMDTIVSKSFLNCHVKGLHSIMLIDAHGQRVRLYYADTNHQLWRNEPTRFQDSGLSIGFHPHHCDLTFKVIQGNITNWVITPMPSSLGITRCLTLNCYLHKSAIVQKGKGSFHLLGRNYKFITKRLGVIGAGLSVQLIATEIHTVAVAEGESAAWLVMEGAEYREHESFCYSNIDLEKLDFTELYQKPTSNQVIQIINKVFFS